MATTTVNAAPATIGDLRRRAGLTQAQLAQRAACSITFIGQLEAGVFPRRSEVVPRVIAVLNEDRGR